MSERTHTVEIEDFGPMTFRPVKKLEMERLRESARRGAVPGGLSSEDRAALSEMSDEAACRACENALLLGHVTDPQFETEELEEAFVGREHLIGVIADAIRERSWPNR